MKKSIYLLVLILPIMSCANASNTENNRQLSAGGDSTGKSASAASGSNINISNFSDIIGIEMKLIEVYIDGRNTNFNRNSLPQGLKDAYVIKFDEKIVSGMAAPNRFTAPYTLSDRYHLSIGLMATTMMAAFIEPENLKEYEFITYMQNTLSWMDENNHFVLSCKTAAGNEVKMIFEL
ncbi:MAG: META domain-containing protein [Treponema sp.]|nr:META domain-containing protein [Treponema sp.]